MGDEVDQPVASAPTAVAVIDETSDQPAPVEDCELSDVDAGEPEFENDVEPLATSAAEDEVTIAADEEVKSAVDLPVEASSAETPDVIADEKPIAPAANS
ncbi:MAG: hypothetical protein KDA41_01925, partial [Planctomycetales bacterium]|nr:hypothetical protein [Planctomycetales bacterium]